MVWEDPAGVGGAGAEGGHVLGREEEEGGWDVEMLVTWEVESA